jgi:hypothetical protein
LDLFFFSLLWQKKSRIFAPLKGRDLLDSSEEERQLKDFLGIWFVGLFGADVH